MSKYGNWHTKSHKKPVRIIAASPKDGSIPPEWLNQAKEMHKEFGREGLLLFFRETEKRDGNPVNSLNVLLSLFGEKT